MRVRGGRTAFSTPAIVAESPQAPEDNPERRQRPRWEASESMLESQPLAVRFKSGTWAPQVGIRLIFIVADPTRSFFRFVDQVLPVARCRMVSATEMPQMRHIGLG